MLCPECNQNLLPISLNTANNYISLDYCNQCAGIWSEQREINFVSPKDLNKIKEFLPQNPAHSSMQYSNYCPRDRTPLEPFRGENVPRDVNILHCGRCSGYWFPEGALFKFKNAQDIKVSYFKTWKIPLPSIYSVLLPALLIAVIGGGVFVSLYSVQQKQDTRTKAHEAISTPFVTYPGNGQVFISFGTNEPTNTNIKYWLKDDVTTEIPVSTTPQTTHSVVIKDLESNKVYHYQIIVATPEELTSQIYTFEVK